MFKPYNYLPPAIVSDNIGKQIYSLLKWVTREEFFRVYPMLAGYIFYKTAGEYIMMRVVAPLHGIQCEIFVASNR